MRHLPAPVISILIPPSKLKNVLLRLCGWEIDLTARVGHSLIIVRRIKLGKNARIGHLNFINVLTLYLDQFATVGHLNRITGPVWIVLKEAAAVGSQNKIIRGKKGVSWGGAMFRLGKWSKITAEHIIDCTRSVKLGEYSILAGRRSQIWTHGYLHAPSGIDRFRIDGSVSIGNNVYIGSACVINASVQVANGITVGAASCVSRSLFTPGLYVSQSLRYIPMDYEASKSRHPMVNLENLVEPVVNRKRVDRSE